MTKRLFIAIILAAQLAPVSANELRDEIWYETIVPCYNRSVEFVKQSPLQSFKGFSKAQYFEFLDYWLNDREIQRGLIDGFVPQVAGKSRSDRMIHYESIIKTCVLVMTDRAPSR